MGLKDSLVSMMGDFVELRRNPDFRSKTELAASTDSDLPNPSQYNPNRRHSLQITCGTQDLEPEMLVHQRTFSINSQKKQQKQQRSMQQKNKMDHDESASLRHEPLYNPRRYKERRASEPMNLLGIGLWARTSGSGHGKQKQCGNDADQSSDHSSTPPSSPIVGSPDASSSAAGRSPAHSLSKSGGTFAGRFFAQQNPIEEAEEFEVANEIDAGQRRQSQSKKRPSLSNLVDNQQQQRFTTVIRL